MLYNWLYPLHTEFSFLNVFRYQSFRIIYAAVTAFLIAFVLAPWVIRKLQDIKLGQQIRDDGPKRHLAKSGTPTMGGILIIFSVTLSTLLWADISRPVCVARARSHDGVRRDRVRRRLSQIYQGAIQGPLSDPEASLRKWPWRWPSRSCCIFFPATARN